VIYFDSAATTMQKPPAVARAASLAIARMASPGRGGHRPALYAAETAFACREAAAELFHVPKPENVVLTFNATHGLNIAIKSLVKPGDTVLISGYEHNAVTRPLAAIGGVTIKVAASGLFRPDHLLRQFEQKLTSEVTAVICNHVSNVFGYILPAAQIAELCEQRKVPFILDASQSAGCLTVDYETLKADFIAMPGHKGLYGPQGTGLLLCRGDAVPLLQGGTGSVSAIQQMPDFLPDRLEAGTHNMPGIAGLLEGIRFVKYRGTDAILRHEQMLVARAAAGLKTMKGIKAYASGVPGTQAGVLAFNLTSMDCEDVGAELGRRGVAVRSGLHCAPLAHNSAGTLETGTVRASFSVFNTIHEVDLFLEQMERLTSR
jgi:cysteine desulfurase family protein